MEHDVIARVMHGRANPSPRLGNAIAGRPQCEAAGLGAALGAAEDAGRADEAGAAELAGAADSVAAAGSGGGGGGTKAGWRASLSRSASASFVPFSLISDLT